MMSDKRKFIAAVADIIRMPQVRRLRKTIHHHRFNRYYHVMHVAYMVFMLCRYLKYDWRNAARAALLHDLFYFDWRNSRLKGYPWMHPVIALKRARRHFTLSAMQMEMIELHMWPIHADPVRMPRYAETWVLIVCDKIQTFCEYIDIPVRFIRRLTGGLFH
ncbi:MAG: hypothetical protein HZC28_08040 [Spirochaetes bacterium]|nr:hypothetical protein [Spirochaetota bacterium]